MKTKKGKGDKVKRIKNLTTDDMLRGFATEENSFESEYMRQRRKLGLAPGKAITIRWK